MANETIAWLIRFKEIEREYRAIRLATDHLLQSLQTGAVNLEGDLKILDINRASERLEGTYIASLFSEFERGLKRFLRAEIEEDPALRGTTHQPGGSTCGHCRESPAECPQSP